MKIHNSSIQQKMEEHFSDFKKRRIQLNLSQIKLAKLSNLSQSIINKLENSKIDPTLSTIIKLDDALSSQEQLSNVTAKEIMITQIKYVDYKTPISNVIEIMLDNDFSQILISKENKIIGVLYENSILNCVSKKNDIYTTPVGIFMEELPLIVPKNYLVSDLSYIFQNKKTKFVLVGNLEKIHGIITKTDVFKS